MNDTTLTSTILIVDDSRTMRTMVRGALEADSYRVVEAKDGVEVLTPNVRTSGGAMWNIAAIYGASKRARAGDGDAEALLAGILGNVVVMDKGARDSLVNFENGVGDAAITYENEVLLSKKEGKPIDYVVPSSTILIENPAATKANSGRIRKAT